MPPTAAIELTLLVAATRQMGIGRGGTLPWTGLRKEMAYFARVTKRLPSWADPSTTKNVVIMGRKTWDSIPEKFRPLKDRLNIVISRSHPATPPPTTTTTSSSSSKPAATEKNEDSVVRLNSLESVVKYIQDNVSTNKFGKIFVIGGGEIYAAALELREAKRVLLTSVMAPEFECDTYFPLRLVSGGDKGGQQSASWEMQSKEALDAWTGEDVPSGIQEENGTEYEFQMWEKKERS